MAEETKTYVFGEGNGSGLGAGFIPGMLGGALTSGLGGYVMIIQDIYLKKYSWSIKIYYAVDAYYTDEILKELEDYNPTVAEYSSIRDLMENYEYNTGFTFTDYIHKKSLMVIGLTTFPEEFQSTFDHEKGHLAIHIAQYYHLDPYGEEFQYLAGSIGKKLFPVAKKFLCNHCRETTLDLFSK